AEAPAARSARTRRARASTQHAAQRRSTTQAQLTSHVNFLSASASAVPTHRRETAVIPTESESRVTIASRLFVLDLAEGRVFSVRPDGSDKKIVATGGHLRDGIAIDADAGHLYWTNMGSLGRNDGSIERVDLDGRNPTTIAPAAALSTPNAREAERRP